MQRNNVLYANMSDQVFNKFKFPSGYVVSNQPSLYIFVLKNKPLKHHKLFKVAVLYSNRLSLSLFVRLYLYLSRYLYFLCNNKRFRL